MQYLVGIGIADATEELRVGTSALQGVILAAQPLGKLRKTRLRDLDAAWILAKQRLLSL